ncbi:MAG: fibronectin type III domain-containing protein [Syntrophobacteraceae bacterium]|jgi:hypothetical protein
MRFSGILLKMRQALCLLIVVVLPLLATSTGRAATCDTYYNPEASSNAKYQLKFDDGTAWQAQGGTISFTLTGLDPQNNTIVACLRSGLKDPNAPNKWSGSFPLTPIRVGETPDKLGTIFNVTLPSDLKLPPARDVIWNLEYDRLYPAAELRVSVFEPSTSTPVLDAVRGIRIARGWFAFLLAAVFVVAAAAALYYFALFLGVPGTRVVLRIISTASGWASLAQFQIILWTLVIGAGAVYVMALRGSLIEISSGALWLLGIAGAAAVGSQLKSSQQAQSAPTLATPGQIIDLATVDSPRESEVTLSWSVPSGGGAPSAYTVQYQPPGSDWVTASTTAVANRRFMLVGLDPNTDYKVQVFATNAAGSGTPMSRQVHTAPPEVLPSGVPKAVDGLHLQENVTADSVPLYWTPVADARGYTVQFRAHDRGEAWRIFGAETTKLEARLTGLSANTVYDFRVFATSNLGHSAPSKIFRETTGVRTPRWSDIVTDTDRPAEIDVTRVQMLFFTVISACFVAMKIVYSGSIPEIPETYVTLMGISNGVYITAKFVGR